MKYLLIRLFSQHRQVVDLGKNKVFQNVNENRLHGRIHTGDQASVPVFSAIVFVNLSRYRNSPHYTGCLLQYVFRIITFNPILQNS